MRTIKFLGLAVALAAVSVSANAQAGRRFDHFMGFDNLARHEARQIERQQMRRFAMRGTLGVGGGRFAGPPRGRQMMMAGRAGQYRAFQRGRRAGMQLGARAGLQLGARAGFRAGVRANASPEQIAFAKQFGEQRQAIRAKVQAGTLTREKARAQMQAWITEHRPKK